jgi:PAS domain S-box-containing protein
LAPSELRRGAESVHDRAVTRPYDALVVSEARTKAIVDSALDCVVTMDASGRIVEWNPAAERCFGHRAAEVVGRDLAEVIIPFELRDAHREGLARYLATGERRMMDRRIETTAVRADGTEFPVEVAITRINETGPPVFTGHLRDITERREAEDEVRASRARLVEVADETRRRLERDLHDGAQQRLVGLALDLQLARETLADDPDAAGELLDGAVAGLREAIDALRELARGIHPAVLTTHGLSGALPDLARRCPLEVRFDGLHAERLPDAVEATVYFFCAETLTNAAKHSGAESVLVAFERFDDRVVVEVCDDGRGGATVHEGTGLRGLGDRVSAVGGKFEVRSTPGEGTVIRVELPCEW